MTSIDFDTVTASLRLHPIAVGLVDGAPARESAARRALNVLVALAGIAITAPLMAVIAAVVKLTSPGPVIYRQPRIGMDRRSRSGGNSRRVVDLGGRPFTIYKFRTMRMADGEAQVWASPTDPRVTPIGRTLRRFRLDELPQLFNVLMGDMNVVGPRPEQPRIFAELREAIPGYHVRQRVRPGITGWAQVNQKYDTCLEDVQRKVGFDLQYVATQSLAQDLRIMARTIPTMAFQRGAW